MIAIRTWLNRGDLPLYRELGPENGNGYQEVADSLKGQKRSMVRVNDRGEVIVSVAVPVQRFHARAINGALMLSTQGDDIDQMVTAERLAILKIGGVASAAADPAVAAAGEHDRARPYAGSPDSAERVRRRIAPVSKFPTFTPPSRRDRASVRYAARHDRRAVQPHRAIGCSPPMSPHELKNPLTSLRSAVEPRRWRARTAARGCWRSSSTTSKRLDRLISDISDASRLDAELQRQDMTPVDLRRLLTALTTVANETRRGNNIAVECSLRGPQSHRYLFGAGPRLRLGQVISACLISTLFPTPSRFPLPAKRCASSAAACAPKSRSLSTTTAPAFARTRWRKSSNGFTPTARIRVSARIPDWACRFRNRSSKPIAAASGPRIAQAAGADGETTIAGARFIVRLPAP